jgi:hypothetical protein
MSAVFCPVCLIYSCLTEPAVYHYPTRVRNYLQYTAAAAAALTAAGAVRLPLLVIHGEQDQTADVQGSTQLVAAAKVRTGFRSTCSCQALVLLLIHSAAAYTLNVFTVCRALHIHFHNLLRMSAIKPACAAHGVPDAHETCLRCRLSCSHPTRSSAY